MEERTKKHHAATAEDSHSGMNVFRKIMRLHSLPFVTWSRRTRTFGLGCCVDVLFSSVDLMAGFRRGRDDRIDALFSSVDLMAGFQWAGTTRACIMVKQGMDHMPRAHTNILPLGRPGA